MNYTVEAMQLRTMQRRLNIQMFFHLVMFICLAVTSTCFVLTVRNYEHLVKTLHEQLQEQTQKLREAQHELEDTHRSHIDTLQRLQKLNLVPVPVPPASSRPRRKPQVPDLRHTA